MTAFFLGSFASGYSQTALPIYTDHLVNGFQDWSWATRNLTNSSPVHSGSQSIRVSAAAYEGISFHQSDFDATLYSSLSFWANGGPGGGQVLQIYAEYGAASGPAFAIPALPANTWKQFVIPLSALGVADKTNLNRITWQLTSGSGIFYLDDIQLNPKPAPSLVHIEVNAAQAIRPVDSRWFSANAAVWDGNFDTPQTISFLNEMGLTALRFPGGSLSDQYHWASNKSLDNSWQWQTSFANFVHVATNAGVQAFITVNYGTGTPEEAAAWVRDSNVTNHFGFKYWEIGNENYGDWETDSNTFPHDPFTYANRAADYIQQMKAADPTIKIGVVVTTGENSYSNQYTLNHPALNPRTHELNYGWTPILLATLKNLGVRPDFVSHHVYPEYTGQESDPLLLQSTRNWASDAADLRQQITDYFGDDGTNIELLCTENNSNSGQQGKQSTSLVNGLYYADSLGQIMKTEFNAFVWWDLRNGTDTSGSMDSTLYGWRTYGDLGMINGLSTKHPTFYAAKLMKYFTRSGDSVLNASSDYLLLSSYASRHANGAVSLLVINKDSTANFNARIALDGFAPDETATIHSFGIPQDEAARTNGPSVAQDIAVSDFSGAATNFDYSFPPLSLTLFTFAPEAPGLVALPVNGNNAFVFQLQGQPSVPYVLQTSTDLNTWISVETNTLSGSAMNFTNTISSGAKQQFWRAVWMR
ncbi:MAG TPA: alpha-L-arabinofuranosidase [Verrucomicrobiae bacterium]|nr:alpha-L-arabinofuranosidase [Verrucomicrobiae bacterium]